MKPKAFLVNVGVDEYDGQVVSDLSFASGDARLIQSALRSRLVKRGYQVIETPLTSPPREGESLATKKNIEKTIERVRDASGPDDLVLLSISSHGYTDSEGAFYVFPQNLGRESEGLDQEVLARCITSEDLSAWLRGVDAQELVLIMDTCHAAASVEGAG